MPQTFCSYQTLPKKNGSNLSAIVHSHPAICSANKAESPAMHNSTSQVQHLSNTTKKPSSSQSLLLHPSACVEEKIETPQMTSSFPTNQATRAQPFCLDTCTTQNEISINKALNSANDELTFQSGSRGNVHQPTTVSQQSPHVVHAGAPCAVQPEASLTPSSKHELQFNGDGCSNPLAELVTVGGNQAVKMSREKYQYCTSGCKPTQVALRFVDTLVPREVLLRSTILGTRELERLDSNILNAIKVEVDRLFLHQCRNIKELSRMWDCCKTSIGKRCQRLRIERKNGLI